MACFTVEVIPSSPGDEAVSTHFLCQIQRLEGKLGSTLRLCGAVPRVEVPSRPQNIENLVPPSGGKCLCDLLFPLHFGAQKAILVRVLDTQASGGQMRGADGLAGTGAPSTRSPSMRTLPEANKANA